jgi:hypothetical protein
MKRNFRFQFLNDPKETPLCDPAPTPGPAAVEACAAGFPNLAHPAFADGRNAFIVAKFVADGKRHEYEQAYRRGSRNGPKLGQVLNYGASGQNLVALFPRAMPAAVPAPAARCPSPRPPACRWGCATGGRRCVQELRRAATSPARRRAACTPVARLRLAILPGARVGWHNALAQPAPPAARSGARRAAVRRRDRLRADGDARGAEGAASPISAGTTRG